MYLPKPIFFHQSVGLQTFPACYIHTPFDVHVDFADEHRKILQPDDETQRINIEKHSNFIQIYFLSIKDVLVFTVL